MTPNTSPIIFYSSWTKRLFSDIKAYAFVLFLIVFMFKRLINKGQNHLDELKSNGKCINTMKNLFGTSRQWRGL